MDSGPPDPRTDRSLAPRSLEPRSLEPRSLEHWAILAALVAAPLALLVLGQLLEPDPRGFGTHEKLGFEPCWMVARFGLPCPGCGVTTAAVLAARGRLGASFLTQPLGALLALGSVALAAWGLLLTARGGDLRLALERLPWRRLALPLGLAVGLAWAYKMAVLRGLL